MKKLYSFKECVFDDIIKENEYRNIINTKAYEIANQLNLERLTDEIIEAN
jgi:hypothetical protein